MEIRTKTPLARTPKPNMVKKVFGDYTCVHHQEQCSVQARCATCESSMEHSSEQPVLLGTHASFVSPPPSLFGLVWQPPKFGSLDALKKGSAGGGDDDDEDKEKQIGRAHV